MDLEGTTGIFLGCSVFCFILFLRKRFRYREMLVLPAVVCIVYDLYGTFLFMPVGFAEWD